MHGNWYIFSFFCSNFRHCGRIEARRTSWPLSCDIIWSVPTETCWDPTEGSFTNKSRCCNTLYTLSSDEYAISLHCFYMFPMLLTRRICLTVKSFLSWQHLPYLLVYKSNSYVSLPHFRVQKIRFFIISSLRSKIQTLREKFPKSESLTSGNVLKTQGIKKLQSKM